EPGRNRDRNECRQIVRVLVLGNLVAQRVSQISEYDQQQKPKTRPVTLVGAREPCHRQKQRQRQPCKAKLTEGHSTKFSKLRSHGRRRKREKYAILPDRDGPPH